MLHLRNKGLEIKGLSVDYQGQTALGSIDLVLPEHGIYTVIGPSGCGKSTLLRSIAGLISSYQGEIQYNGVSLRDGSRSQALIGLVPQNYGLLPWKTVQSNIRTAMRITRSKRLTKQQEIETIEQWLSAMGISELAQRYPLSLSGGQQQRVAIARAFAIMPQIMLFDEPFSALDAMTREDLQSLFLDNWRGNPTTTLFVTHDVEEAILLGQKIVMMPASKTEPPVILENPVFELNHRDKRDSEEFFQQTKIIRKVMGEKW